MIHIRLPARDEEIARLRVGDTVHLSGVMLTARDAAHKYMLETLIQRDPPPEEAEMYARLKADLDGGAIYHCGPVVRQTGDGRWQFVSAGPTTSAREEVYEDHVIEHFHVKAIIGKGGMGPRTLAACAAHTAVYLHAIGGAGSLIAASVEEVVDVYKKEAFGSPEAFWKIRVRDFPTVVTMDSHGNSLHAEVLARSKERLAAVVG